MTTTSGIVITESTYIDRVWFTSWGWCDIFGVLSRETPTSLWRLQLRARRYVDDKIWESNDEKIWTTIEGDDPSGLRVTASRYIQRLEKLFGSPGLSDEFDVHGGVHEYGHEMRKRSWAYLKPATGDPEQDRDPDSVVAPRIAKEPSGPPS